METKDAKNVFGEYESLSNTEKNKFGRLLLAKLIGVFNGKTENDVDLVLDDFFGGLDNLSVISVNHEIINNAVCLSDLANTIKDEKQKHECKVAIQKAISFYDKYHSESEVISCLYFLPYNMTEF
jgi:hypothetical protein